MEKTPSLRKAPVLEPAAHFQVVALEALMQMKLDSNRLKDRVEVLDRMGVGMGDASWPSGLPSTLAGRWQQLLDIPQG